jgi:hypothetical protein
MKPDYSRIFYHDQPDDFRAAVMTQIISHGCKLDSYNGNGLNVEVIDDGNVAIRKSLVAAIEALGLFWDNAWTIAGKRLYRFTLG